ncbi:hypothetical protein Alches_27420 [Alicyclobacillus hesperidum subsp. aegles]|nr:hypothetical protein Alches_27420 [Alicyclobacillus hesperidum subsp. aegles]
MAVRASAPRRNFGAPALLMERRTRFVRLSMVKTTVAVFTFLHLPSCHLCPPHGSEHTVYNAALSRIDMDKTPNGGKKTQNRAARHT